MQQEQLIRKIRDSSATVAITGASGFIGCQLVRLHLARGDRVRILTRQPQAAQSLGPVEVVLCDLAHPEVDALARFCDGADVIYHCAAQLGDPARMHGVNVLGTRRLLEFAQGRCNRWVQLSSVGVYGPAREGIVDESCPLAPQSEYEATKAEADRLVEQAAAAEAFSHTILRPSIVFGPNMPNRSLRQLVSAVARGMFFFIGPPGASANYIYVDNVVEALIACGTLPAARGRTYNLSDFRTMEEFVGAVAASIGKSVPHLRLPESPVRRLARTLGRLPGIPLTESRVDALTSRARYPSSRIERELGYVHRVSMEDGLQRLVESWREEH
jgi:nucleoside-diphosphate-sugar epimerase